MLHKPDALRLVCLVLILAWAPLSADVVITEGSEFGVDVSPVDGQIAMDVLGSIWTLPAVGGLATRRTDGLTPAIRPRWSPDGSEIMYQLNTADGAQIWQLDTARASALRISKPGQHDQDAAWHPQGERIVYSSDRGNSGLDIWETDLATGLSWRLTDHPGDELEPTWSANGRHLAYIRRTGSHYILVLRRFGEVEVNLVESDTPLFAPSWRPDGSLLTFIREEAGSRSLEMVILSTPVIIRKIPGDEDFFRTPVGWPDRMHMIYAADGSIKTRDFEDRESRRLPFEAIIINDSVRTSRTIASRELEIIDAPENRLVIRAARLFDGVRSYYREKVDVLIDAGRIVAVEAQRDWDNALILDLGEFTIVPGLIDTWSALPDEVLPGDGPALLAYGVTTLVSDSATSFNRRKWESESSPGPRFLPAASVSANLPVAGHPDYFLIRLELGSVPIAEARRSVQAWHDAGVPIIADTWIIGQRLGADILLGAASIPYSQLSDRYRSAQLTLDESPDTLISGLADGDTAGINSLLNSRQARELGQSFRPARRFSARPQLATTSASIVAGSKTNGMPSGLALHAELRALSAAGLTGEQVLYTVGRNAAKILGLEHQIGTIVPGAVADLVLVRGDPLANVDDLLEIVAVVRNGRFFSLVSLLERAGNNETVE